jgi:hypothetical protein
VVTTAVGLRGYEAFAHLVTLAGLDDFVGAVQAQHRVVHQRPELAQLSWSALGQRLYAVYADLLAQRPRSRSS